MALLSQLDVLPGLLGAGSPGGLVWALLDTQQQLQRSTGGKAATPILRRDACSSGGGSGSVDRAGSEDEQRHASVLHASGAAGHIPPCFPRNLHLVSPVEMGQPIRCVCAQAVGTKRSCMLGMCP